MRPLHRRSSRALASGLIALAATRGLSAQTDYYNSDAGRPLTIEDAYALERRSIEIQAAPVRFERLRGRTYRWGIEPEVAIGLFPRTQVEIGVPLAVIEEGPSRGGGRRAGAAGVDVSVLYNLNRETRLPAFAIAVGGLLPAGALGPDSPYGSVKGIMTRTFPGATRVHANVQANVGPRLSLPAGSADPVGGNVLELSRWLAGVAVDRPLALRSVLLGGEVFARAPIVRGQALEWNAGVGARWQADVRWTMDAGLGRHLTGDDRGWYLTVGGAYAMGWPWRPPATRGR
jgi:hypothetical protein